MGFIGFLVSMIFLSLFIMVWWFWCGCLFFKGGSGSDVVIVDGGYQPYYSDHVVVEDVVVVDGGYDGGYDNGD